jgi:hypothetical protein
MLASPPMKTRRPSLREVVMCPARRLIGATCRGRPHRRLPATLKCHCRTGHRRPDATRPLARAHAKGFVPHERTSGWSAHVRYLAERVLLSHRDLHAGKLIPREGRRSGRRPPASSMTAPTAPTLTSCRGTGRGGGHRTRVDAERAAFSGAECCPATLAVVAYPGRRSPGCLVSLVTSGGHGPNPAVAEAEGTSPEHMGESVAAVEAAGRSEVAPETTGPRRAVPEQGSKCATPEQGTSDRPVKKARVRSKM